MFKFDCPCKQYHYNFLVKRGIRSFHAFVETISLFNLMKKFGIKKEV